MMEESSHKFVLSRKNESRSLFKKCFKDPMFSLVPFEIWRDFIVSNADLKTIFVLSQTCHAFKEIVDNIGENNFNLALLLRREGRIDLARKYLLICAENKNLTAMFHLGDAYRYCDWGLEEDEEKGAEWLKKSAELGNAHAMVFYSDYLGLSRGVSKNREFSNVWAKKALSSNNSFAVGYCYYYGLGAGEDPEKAFLCFEVAAKEGDEFGQYYLGICFRNGFGTQRNDEKALYWRLKAAEQGNCFAQHQVGRTYREGIGCKKDEQKAINWYKKSAKQGHKNSIDVLEEMGIEIEWLRK